ncbi:YbaB/EbfC family nucleoid-associated protein [Phenylobacterium sp.]|uniref:YbaB/EbfC family nucleoid-associated protein n=1 Tax=Phenylobacterium sp. TaxID=1871053 RepID=UPI002F4175CF
MKDFGNLMKQAQAMQQKLADAQAKLAEMKVEGSSGGGMVKLTLKGSGELSGVEMDESLLAPGEGEVLADLIVAAHADAKRKLDQKQQEMMAEVAGPLAGMPGMPKF